MFVLLVFCIGFVRCGRQKYSVILRGTYLCFFHLLVFSLQETRELWGSTKPLSRSVCPVQEGLVLFLGSLLISAVGSVKQLSDPAGDCSKSPPTAGSIGGGGISHSAADSASCALALMVNFGFM